MSALALGVLLSFSAHAQTQASDPGQQRGEALGSYLMSMSIINQLITGYCPGVKFKSMQPGAKALEQERPYISPDEYQRAEKYIASKAYDTGVRDAVLSLSAGIAQGVDEGMDRGTSCGLMVGIFIGTAKAQKGRWDSLKMVSRKTQ